MTSEELLESENLVAHALQQDHQYGVCSYICSTDLNLVKLITANDELLASVALLESLDPLGNFGIPPITS